MIRSSLLTMVLAVFILSASSLAVMYGRADSQFLISGTAGLLFCIIILLRKRIPRALLVGSISVLGVIVILCGIQSASLFCTATLACMVAALGEAGLLPFKLGPSQEELAEVERVMRIEEDLDGS